MQYVGSKNKIAKHLLPIILRERERWYVEPFVGGCNMIDKVDGPRTGNDSNTSLVAMWKSLQNGWIPPTDVSKEFYYKVKAEQDNYPPELVCFIAMLCSFGGKWWGGYAFNNAGDNYAARGSRVLLKQIEKLKDVVFTAGSYKEMDIPSNSIVYCDIPYEGTVQYKDKFNHLGFWDWAREKEREGHKVFVSEYTAPADFECLIEVAHKTILDKNSQKPRLERLFRLRK